MPDYRTEPDPLCELPSLFALTRGGPGKKAQGPARDDLASLLAIDPVLALRAIRMAGATILGKDELTVATPRLLLQRLGTGVISRMATAPAPAFANVDEVVALWLHAIASAILGALGSQGLQLSDLLVTAGGGAGGGFGR